MDLSGTAFGLGANTPFSTAHFDESDAGAGAGAGTGAGAFHAIQSSITDALQHHMNVAARASPDARDVSRPWSARLAETLAKAEADVVKFLQTDETSEMPCVDRHRHFLRGLTTPGFLSSPSWTARNVRGMVDHDAIVADISGALGMSVTTLRETLASAMALYLPTVDAMDVAYQRLQRKLTQIETITRQVNALRLPAVDTTPELEAFQTTLLRYIESLYVTLHIEADYKEVCGQYDRFQIYRSILSLAGPRAQQPMCAICMTETVSAAVVPCGHTFCARCCGTQRNVCYICRTPVRDRQRLYFG